MPVAKDSYWRMRGEGGGRGVGGREGEGGGGSAFGFRPFNWIKETAPREEIVGVGYNLIKV